MGLPLHRWSEAHHLGRDSAHKFRQHELPILSCGLAESGAMVRFFYGLYDAAA